MPATYKAIVIRRRFNFCFTLPHFTWVTPLIIINMIYFSLFLNICGRCCFLSTSIPPNQEDNWLADEMQRRRELISLTPVFLVPILAVVTISCYELSTFVTHYINICSFSRIFMVIHCLIHFLPLFLCSDFLVCRCCCCGCGCFGHVSL